MTKSHTAAQRRQRDRAAHAQRPPAPMSPPPMSGRTGKRALRYMGTDRGVYRGRDDVGRYADGVGYSMSWFDGR